MQEEGTRRFYHLTHAVVYYSNNSVKSLGKRLQCTGLHGFFFGLCSLLTSTAREHCLASGTPNCDGTPSLTPSEHVRRTEEGVIEILSLISATS